MPDWTGSMEQSYEFYIVDPDTWKDSKLLDTVKKCTIKRDSGAETLGSATIDISESVGECYIRIYLITVQNGVKEKYPLGTFLVQTPASNHNGKIRNVSMDAYTPLIELKEKLPPIGYYVAKNSDETVLEAAHRIAQENVRAPVVPTKSAGTLTNDFVAEPDDTYLGFITDLIKNVRFTDEPGKIKNVTYKFDIDEMGRILFAPEQETKSLQPIWTYDDGNSSILYPNISMDHDLYGIPNVVEVICSNGDNSERYHAKVRNDDENSPTSTVNRGREIIHRVTDPGFTGIPSKEEVDEYAKKLLKELSTIEYTVTYTHGYCPVRVNDCVLLNYSKAGLTNIKAKVISQSIKCEPGCPVTEKAVFTTKLWG